MFQGPRTLDCSWMKLGRWACGYVCFSMLPIHGNPPWSQEEVEVEKNFSHSIKTEIPEPAKRSACLSKKNLRRGFMKINPESARCISSVALLHQSEKTK